MRRTVHPRVHNSFSGSHTVSPPSTPPPGQHTSALPPVPKAMSQQAQGTDSVAETHKQPEMKTVDALGLAHGEVCVGSSMSSNVHTDERDCINGEKAADSKSDFSESIIPAIHKDTAMTSDEHCANSQFVEIQLDEAKSNVENIEILSEHYKIPNILVKSLFELNNKRKRQFLSNSNIDPGNGTGTGDVSRFILDLENEIIEFVIKPTVDSWKMKPLNSYYRLLSHQLADYYHLGHILSNDGSSMVLFKINTSLINADDETKRNAKFDQSGNIRPLDFRNLKFDPREKLDRIKLIDVYRSYKDLFQKIAEREREAEEAAEAEAESDDQNVNNFDQLHISENSNFDAAAEKPKNVRIMQRKANTGNEEHQQRHNDSLLDSPATSKAAEETTLSKEERYKLTKERIEREHGDENNYEGSTDRSGYVVNNSNNSRYRKNQHDGIYRRNSKNYNNNYNKHNGKHSNYNNNNNNSYRMRPQYVYYPSSPIYSGITSPTGQIPNSGGYGYVLAPPNSSPNMGMNMVNSPLGSPTTGSSTIMPAPPYYYIPVTPPVDNLKKNGDESVDVDTINGDNATISDVSPVTSSSSHQPPSITVSTVPDDSSIGSQSQATNSSPTMPVVVPVVTSPDGRQMFQYYYPVRGNQYYSGPSQSSNGSSPTLSTSPNGMYVPMMYYGDDVNGQDNAHNAGSNTNVYPGSAVNKSKKYYNANSNGGYSKKSSKSYGRKNSSGYNNGTGNSNSYGYGYGYGYSGYGYANTEYSNGGSSGRYSELPVSKSDDH